MQDVHLRSIRLGASALCLGAIFFGCTEQTSPTAPRLRQVGTPLTVGTTELTASAKKKLKQQAPLQLLPTLQRATPLLADLHVTKVLDQRGGVIKFPKAGIDVQFPAGALPGPTAITVTALAGDAVAYDFQPHLVFPAGVTLSVDLKGLVGRHAAGLPLEMYGGFVPEGRAGIQNDGSAAISELFKTEVSLVGKRVKFKVPHFTGYVLVGR
jgi:hypothetical protein